MRLAASNIAWLSSEASTAYALLERHGARGLEIAPGLAFPGEADPFAPSDSAIKEFVRDISTYGLELVSMQSLLFGFSGAQLFGTDDEQTAFVTAIERALILGNRMGISNLVLGSPSNRRYPSNINSSSAQERASAIFRRLGDRASSFGLRIAIEPNPAAYGTNFLTTVEATAAFVDKLDHPGITMNFDIGALLMNCEQSCTANILDLVGSRISHVHISEPDLAPAPAVAEELNTIATAFAARSYKGWFSIEMRRDKINPLKTLDGSLRRAASVLDGRKGEHRA